MVEADNSAAAAATAPAEESKDQKPKVSYSIVDGFFLSLCRCLLTIAGQKAEGCSH